MYPVLHVCMKRSEIFTLHMLHLAVAAMIKITSLKCAVICINISTVPIYLNMFSFKKYDLDLVPQP